MGNNKKKRVKGANKIVVLITYVIALACLIAGLCLPLGNTDATGTDAMLVLQLPKVIDYFFKTNIGKTGFTYSTPVNFFDILKDKTFDVGALFVMLYAVVTVLGVLALIPVILGKKDKRTSIKFASAIEGIALVFVAILFIINFETYALGASKLSYALLIAFGGTLVMLLVQALADKGSSGFMKFFLVLLSAVALFGTVMPLTGIVKSLSGKMNGIFDKGFYFPKEGGEPLFGIYAATYPFLPGFIEMLKAIPDKKDLFLMIFTIALALLVILNFLLDLLGMAKRTNKAMLICNIIRYALEVVAAIAVIVMAFLLKTLDVNLLLYALAVIAVLQLIIEIVRTVAYSKRKKKEALRKKRMAKMRAQRERELEAPAAQPVPEEAVAAAPVAPVAASEPAVVDKKAEKVAAKQAAKEAKEAEKAAKVAAKTAPAETVADAAPEATYNVEPIYNGPIDSFISKLSNAEKIEFAQTFIERKRGALSNIPEYVVDGNNTKFFASIFIYYGRIRDYISDGLMNKMYEEGNMMY